MTALLHILFWIFFALDCAAIGLFLLLGLAAAGPSHSNPLWTGFLMLAVPGSLLAGVAALFLLSKSPVGKGIALVLAAGPVLVVAFGGMMNAGASRLFQDKDGELRHFVPGKMRELERAIARNDAAAVAAMAPTVDVNSKAPDGYTVLAAAVYQLDKTPRSLDVLRALLAAGADPNLPQMAMPLEVAIRVSRKTGLEPVKMLLRAGANGNARNRLGEPVYFAAVLREADPGALALVLDHGADLRARTSGGFSPLLWATTTKNWNAALLLLQRGADVNDRAQHGETFLERIETEKGYVGNKEGFDELMRYLKR